MKKYGVDDVVVYREGLCMCSVCVPKDMPVKELLRLIPSTGIKSQWTVSKDNFRDGDGNPVPCNSDPDRLHYLMEC